MEIVIRQILSDFLDDIAASQQRLHFLMDILSGIVNEGANNRIVAGVPPITGRLYLWIFPQVPQIVHHIPGTVDIQLPEVIAVVPSLHIFGVVRLVCVDQDLIYLFLRETEVFVQMGGRDRIRDEIICPGKNALFRDAQTARNDRKAQGIIILQCLQHALHHIQHLIIISVGAGLGDGHITLVDKKDHRFAIVCLH